MKSPPLCLILVLSLLTASCIQAAPSPNIILFLVDDMGWMDSEPYGSTFYETPALTRLAREGMLFRDAYAQPLCSPTRASILSGKDAPARFSMHQAITAQSQAEPIVPKSTRPDRKASWPQSKAFLPLEERTIAEALKDVGYQTWHLGKWHLGNAEKYGPHKQGFEKVIGAGGAGPGGSYFAPNKIPMLKPGPQGEYICERLTQEACTLLDQRDVTKPFFMYFSHFNVHSPYEAKSDLVEYFQKKADPTNLQHNPVMAAMLRSMDESLGQLLSKLDALKLDDKTILVFLSDNGGVHWKSRVRGGTDMLEPTSNLPLRGGKCCFYEGGVRVPMIVRYPGKVNAKTVCYTPVHVTDLYPTFLELVGSEPQANQVLDGISLLPLLTQQGAWKRYTIFGHFPRASTTAGTVGGSWIRQGDYKMIRRWFDGAELAHAYELYNLKADIGEAENLASVMPEKVKMMSQHLDAWLSKTNARLPIPNPNYDPEAKEPKKRQR